LGCFGLVISLLLQLVLKHRTAAWCSGYGPDQCRRPL
jgi:hypothetical protein